LGYHHIADRSEELITAGIRLPADIAHRRR
jgi:hypothetical protein